MPYSPQSQELFRLNRTEMLHGGTDTAFASAASLDFEVFGGCKKMVHGDPPCGGFHSKTDRCRREAAPM
jgi:hypothetical protein